MKNESALGEALKAMEPQKREKQTIRICDDCGTPMLWTFFFPYCEWYCLNCGASGGMLGTGENVEATRELIFKKKLAEAIWKVLRDKMVPPGSYTQRGCKKCGTEDHPHHLFPSEKEWNKIATPYLERVRGLLDEQTTKEI